MKRPISIFKCDTYTLIRVFGLNIYLTRRYHLRRQNPVRNRARTSVKHQRLERAGFRCELCGEPITISCSLFRIWPKGYPLRNSLENVRVICGPCKHHCDRVGGFRPMITQAQEGGEA